MRQESMECIKSSFKREVQGDESLPQETRKNSNKNLNLYLKELEKEQTKATLQPGKKL